MLKGVNRNVLVVRADKNSRFESVYFVMKKGSNAERADILKEANRIISQSGMAVGGGKFRRSPVVGFLAGAVSGGILTVLVWIISALVK